MRDRVGDIIRGLRLNRRRAAPPKALLDLRNRNRICSSLTIMGRHAF